MHSVKKSPMPGVSKHTSGDTRRPVYNPSSNPFDSDDEMENKQTSKISGRTSSEPSLFTSNLTTNHSVKKSPLHGSSKQSSGDARRPVNKPSSNPFDSDDELENKQTPKISGRTSSEPSSLSASNLSTNHSVKKSPLRGLSKHTSGPSSNPYDSDNNELADKKIATIPGRISFEPSSLFASNLSTNHFDDEERNSSSSSQRRYKNGFSDSGGLENQSIQELENYAAYRAEETTKAVNNCLKIAGDIRETASETLVTLHQQGEQIAKTHMVAAEIDHDLSMGEKLLGSLGGMFSKTWKPKKMRSITGPVITRDDLVQRKSNHLEQRERLGLTSASKECTRTRTPTPEPASAMQKVEVEKAKQDDAFSDLSNILGDLKEMAIDMGSEIDRQNKGMDHFQDDVEELSFRVKGANQRTRHLLRK
ncbi:Helical region found in SNAREs [Salvia divinorum]|uniref:Helical region found in SNAREs n=1 Tax=Salvia divinorum TaxID=28513 RepID=A0ABD1GC35_SALDI